MGIAARAVDHGARHATPMRDPGENIAPYGGVLPTAVVQHHDAPRGHIVDVVTDRAWRLAGGSVQNRERASGEPEGVVERLDVQTLTGDTQTIERVAERGGVELRRARDGDVCLGVVILRRGGHSLYSL